MLRGKPSPVEIKGIKGKEDAIAAVEKSILLYQEKYSSKA
jgi:hypothetical protein